MERLRRGELFAEGRAPWLTVRDAISDLPDPERFPENTIPNHRHNPGARTYKGHTGSRLDEPAKTLKAGDHGVPGGRTCWRARMDRSATSLCAKQPGCKPSRMITFSRGVDGGHAAVGQRRSRSSGGGGSPLRGRQPAAHVTQ